MFVELGATDTAWAGKTAPEVQGIAQEDGSILIVPVGSIEQHGDHLPVSTDTILVDAVAHAGAKRIADDVPLLVTPTVWHGYSPHHLPFGGTITLDVEELIDVLEAVADSALENGFNSLLLLNGHGGNMSIIDNAVKTIGREHPEATVHGLTYFTLATRFIDDIRDSEPGGMSHGGEFETSLMMHLRPDLVRADRMEATHKEATFDYESTDLMDGGELGTYRTFDEYSDSGAIGAPELASAEKGEAILEGLKDEMEALLTQLHEQHE